MSEDNTHKIAVGEVMMAFTQTVEKIKESKPKRLKSAAFKSAKSQLMHDCASFGKKDSEGRFSATEEFLSLGKAWNKFSLLLAENSMKLSEKPDEWDYLNIAEALYRVGNFEMAKSYAFDGIGYFEDESNADEDMVSDLYTIVAKSYLKLGRPKEAEENAIESYMISKKDALETGSFKNSDLRESAQQALKLLKKINTQKQEQKKHQLTGMS